MGHKTHPLSLRLGFTKNWSSLWFANKENYPKYLHEDLLIRETIKKTFSHAAISKVVIERSSGRVRVILHTARPGIVIGRRGADIDRLRDDIHSLTQKEILVDVKEVKYPAIDGQLVSENVAIQLERRISFRRAMKKAIQLALQSGALGIKIQCSGRLGGAEMCRTENYKEGKFPLHTLKADIDYGFTEAKTVYGKIGVKVWVYKGDGQLPGQKDREAGDPKELETQKVMKRVTP
ncbi:MAG: 30S ribosomal protein S3 [Candidatus Omnitrophota bacterium]